jgi:hypothetical protein
MLAIVPSIIGLAGAAAHEGDGQRAASLLGQLGRLQGRLELGTAERREVEQAESMAVALLGTDRFLVSFEQGKAAGLEELLPEP